MNEAFIEQLEALTQRAYELKQIEAALLLAMVCGSLRRGDIVDLHAVAEDFLKIVARRQTLKLLAENAKSGLNFSEN